MMRKIGLNRPGRLGLGPKKVAPPQVPGEPHGLRRISGVYSESGLPPGADAFNASFESFSSEGAPLPDGAGAYPPSEGSLYGGSSRGAPSPPCRPDSLYMGRGPGAARPAHPAPQGAEVTFKEPYVPYRSASTVSSPTDPSPTKGSRNSMSSIDSGWASNPVPGFSSFCSRASNSSLNSDKTSFSNEELETRPILHQQFSQPSLNPRRLSTISVGPPPPKRQSSTSSFSTSQAPARNSLRPAGSQESVGRGQQGRPPTQQSHYSSSSSLGSSRNGEDSICTLDLSQMVEQGVPPEEVVNCWLADLRFQEYFSLFTAAGYDMQTISRMTPEDLTAIGIKKPHHRKKLTAEIAKLTVPDGLPAQMPQTMDELMGVLRLGQYLPGLRAQGYHSVQDALSISIEDLEDIGFYQLGHQKRLLLGLRRVKELRSGRKTSKPDPLPPYQPEEVTMASLPPATAPASHRQSFSSFHQAAGPTESRGQLRFPPHPHPGQYHCSSGPPSLHQDPAYHHQGPPYHHQGPPYHHQGPPFGHHGPAFASEGPSSLSYEPHYLPLLQPSPPPPDMPSPMAPLNHSIPGLHQPLPPPLSPLHQPLSPPLSPPLPHPEPLYQHFYPGQTPPPPQPPTWYQQTSTPMQTTVQVHEPFSTNDGQQCGGLVPRPTAMVHPLPTPMEHDLCPNDVHMPFANERSGTIKLKTSPTEAFARLHAEQAAQETETKEAEEERARQGSLLKTPTRAGNRTAGDVMDDISTMLADLTDELDSMLCSDSVPQ